eukprot:TRINITY_DN618_c1_g1_i4.p1 TRINITY_DN618_c1_g1~~TRINITY_DN618_c1_g1_i4.p1  ORF type:complete len:1434 (-),score=474.80 TRINITY_DN618_c1_g1_i4:1760-6061(-)
MEEETQVSSVEVQVTKVADNTGSDVDSNKPSAMVQGGETDSAINGDLHQTTKEEEETALDGEFIKVEKESASVPERTSSKSMESRDSIEPSERMKMLELELERVAKELQHSELEKAQLKDGVVVAKEKLEEKGKHCEDLELIQKRLQEQIKESEEKYKTQLDALQEAVGAQEAKHKELIDMKEAFDGLNVELENSKKKMKELEQELQSSASDALKFEELSKQRDSRAEFESQKALEFERLLEMAKSSAKEMEDQMTSVQEELKGLYEKIAENQRTEEALNSTLADLSAVRGELELSKAQLLNMEGKISSTDVVINELTQELNMRKASEEQMKGDIVALENLFSSAKEDLQVKVASLEEIELKLQEEVKMKEAVEAILKNREADISSVQEELAKVTEEKASLEAAVEDLNSNMLQMKELCSDLETKLKLSDDNFSKADSLLSQALSHNAELEEKIQALETLHKESGTVAATATQRNLELEDIIRTSSTAEEEAKSQLRDIEMRLISVEQKNIELEQQLNMAEIKNTDADRELKEYSDKTAELTALLKGFEGESVKLKMQLREYEEKITHVESTLSLSSLRNSELEQELKDAVEKCAEHEGRASVIHQRSLELEDLIQMSESKAEEAGKKVGEMELLLGSANYSLRELEEQIAISEKRCQDAEAESKQHSDTVSELTAELETFQAKSSSLEIALQVANEKELELRESLNIANEEREKYEGLAKSSSEKLSETENVIEVLRSELKSTQDKLESIELDLKNSGIKESEIMEKLKSAEEQLEEQSRIMEQATARSAEFELLHQSLAKDSEAKLQEAIESISQKELEATDLYKKLKTIEDQAIIYQEQVAEAAEREASLRAELAESSAKLVSQQETIDELKSKILEVETRVGQSFSENELLAETNLKLKQELETHLIKINEHQELLSAVHVEKEAISEQLASHMKTITELTDQHSRGLELQSSTESRARDAELQLQEAIEKFNQKDSYAQDLIKKLTALETQVKLSEEHANEAVATAESRKVELEEALLKLNQLEGIVGELQSKASQFETKNEGLAEANLKLTQELAAYETKVNELQTALNAAFVEKEETLEQLHSSKKTIEDLSQQLVAEGHKLQSQISSVMEENNLLTKTYQDAKEELQAVIVQLETQLSEQKERENALSSVVENLKAELTEKSALQTRIEELEEQLLLAKTHLKQEVESLRAVAAEKEAGLTSQLEEHATKLQERDALHEQVVLLQMELNLAHTTIAEQKEADSRKEVDSEAALKLSQVEIEAKQQQTILLAKQVEELEQKLQLAEAKYNEKDIEDAEKLALLNAELDNLKDKLSESAESEKKIMELENQLKLAKSKSEEQAKQGIQSEVKDGVEVASRDLGSMVSTPSKRKSRRRSETLSTQTAEISSAKANQTTEEPSLSMSIKFILGVALVSVIIGVILGKRY